MSVNMNSRRVIAFGLAIVALFVSFLFGICGIFKVLEDKNLLAFLGYALIAFLIGAAFGYALTDNPVLSRLLKAGTWGLSLYISGFFIVLGIMAYPSMGQISAYFGVPIFGVIWAIYALIRGLVVLAARKLNSNNNDK